MGAVMVGLRFAGVVPGRGGARKRLYLIEAGGMTGGLADRVIPPTG
jgi:hypothetical protein